LLFSLFLALATGAQYGSRLENPYNHMDNARTPVAYFDKFFSERLPSGAVFFRRIALFSRPAFGENSRRFHILLREFVMSL